jgi:hypothetical protein
MDPFSMIFNELSLSEFPIVYDREKSFFWTRLDKKRSVFILYPIEILQCGTKSQFHSLFKEYIVWNLTQETEAVGMGVQGQLKNEEIL